MKNQTHQPFIQSKQAIELSTKLRLLTEVTFNLKCAAFKIIDMPIQTFKHKSNTVESSILTTLDSIFHDLKKVQTLLNQHSRKYDTRQNENRTLNYDYEKDCSIILKNFDKKSVIIDSKKDVSFQRNISEISLLYDPRKDNLKRTKKINHLVSQSSFANQNDQFCHYWGQKSQTNQKLLMPSFQNDHKKSNKTLNITKVSSTQYLGITPNPIINIKSQFKYQKKDPSPPCSEFSCQKVSVDWKSIQEEEHLKDKENQEFIQSIQRKRQIYLKNISRKKEKCFNTIEKINQQISHERERSVSASQRIGNGKRKSKTEKFKQFQYKKNENKMSNANNLTLIYDAA